MDFRLRNVAELQEYLRLRGVVISGFRKQELVDLCCEAEQLGIDIDPDGILEIKSETVTSKLLVKLDDDSSVNLPLPSLLPSSNDFSFLPFITTFDVLTYLNQSRFYSWAEVRDHTKMEGYGMYQDGFVLDVTAGKFEAEAENFFYHIHFRVKPRCRTADPLTGLQYYLGWIILSSSEKNSRIVSAYCCCCGG